MNNNAKMTRARLKYSDNIYHLTIALKSLHEVLSSQKPNRWRTLSNCIFNNPKMLEKHKYKPQIRTCILVYL